MSVPRMDWSAIPEPSGYGPDAGPGVAQPVACADCIQIHPDPADAIPSVLIYVAGTSYCPDHALGRLG